MSRVPSDRLLVVTGTFTVSADKNELLFERLSFGDD